MGPNWGLGLYLAVQAQIGLPLIRDLVGEVRGTVRRDDVTAGPKAPRSGMLPRRWPEGLAATATLVLTALLASGWVRPMLPWLG